MSDTTGEFEYTVAFLTAGDYAVALTCDADADAADSDVDITVEINQTTTVDF